MKNEQLLTHLSDKGYTVKRENLLSLPSTTANVAWYQHLLLGVGVLAAFGCFLLLLSVSDFLGMKPIGQSLWAVGFIAVAVGLYRGVVGIKSQGDSLKTVFVTQVTFVLIVMGYVLLFANIMQYFELTKAWQATVVIAVLTAITFPIYPVMLSRILSVVALLFFVQILIPYGEFSVIASLYQSLVFLALLVALLYLSFSLKMLVWQYLRYAIIITLLVNLTFSPFIMYEISGLFAGYRSPSAGAVYAIFYPTLIIAVVLCGCVLYLAGEQRQFYGVWLLCAALLVLAYFLPATLFFALLLMVLGYATHDKVIMGLGLVLMPYYLFKYYYDLQWTLLDKSLLLMASGMLLLVVAFVVARLPDVNRLRVNRLRANRLEDNS